ncbi:diacylglycerol/lipid kinase family protein [Flavobacterium sp.]
MNKENICLLVVNPISGDVDKTEISNKIIAYCDASNFKLIIYETGGDNDESKILKLYEEHQPDRVLIAGGDGTIKMVGEVFEKHDVIFGIIPAGSANGLSVDLNLPTTLEENIKVAFGFNYIEIDMIEINGKKSLHLSDLGANAQLVKNYEMGTTRGKLGYALQVVSTLQDLDDPFSAVIELNGKTVECVAAMIVVANSQKYGTGVTINPNGLINDGKFEIVVINNIDLLLLGKIVMGNIPVDTEEVQIYQTDKATIKTSKKVSFQIDGEYCGDEDFLDITILPNQMKIAIP